MAYHGKQYRGAARDLKAAKRREAEERNAKTPSQRRKAFLRTVTRVSKKG